MIKPSVQCSNTTVDLNSLISEVRNHYVRQFYNFVERQSERCKTGSAEVKFRIEGSETRFKSLYCGDFVCTDNGNVLIEMTPDQILTFSPIDGSFGDTRLKVNSLSWDDIQIRHDLNSLPIEEIGQWFGHWFDENDARLESEADFAGVIHVLDIEPDRISVDFGTAQPEAFWSLLQIILDAKPALLEISTSRTLADES